MKLNTEIISKYFQNNIISDCNHGINVAMP